MLLRLQSRPTRRAACALSFTTFVQIAFLADVHRRRISGELRSLFAVRDLLSASDRRGRSFPLEQLGASARRPSRYRLDLVECRARAHDLHFRIGQKVLIADTLSPHVTTVFVPPRRIAPITGGRLGRGALPSRRRSISIFCFFGHGRRRQPAVQFPAPHQLRRAVSCDQRARFLAALAHHPVAVPSRLCLRPLTFGRPPGWWRAINVLITMVLAGVWHGASWDLHRFGSLSRCCCWLMSFSNKPRRRGIARPGPVAFLGQGLTFHEAAFVVRRSVLSRTRSYSRFASPGRNGGAWRIRR